MSLATVTYLGKQVGHRQVCPLDANVTAVVSSVPRIRRKLRHFLGMAGSYRCFCKNLSVVVVPLTKQCSPVVPFDAAKSLLCSTPVLAAPDFSRPCQLELDASATGAGAVLLQKSDKDMCQPVWYFFTKFKHHQLKYSTIEETLAMLLTLQHFEVYVGWSSFPVTLYADHYPLVFLAQMYNSNQQLDALGSPGTGLQPHHRAQERSRQRSG